MQIATQSALVAGGGSGIGAAAARHLASLGAKVAVLDVNLDGARSVAQEFGGLALACDIASGNSAEEAIAKAREAHGPARILVNCAGILSPGRILGKDGPLSLDLFRRVIEVNLIGAFNLLRLAAADMAKLAALADGERGVVINTSSIAAYEGQIGQIAYATSKAGMAGMTLPAARDLARHGIRVLSVAPGLVATPMLTNLPQDMQEALAQSIPFPQRLADPTEVARLIQHMIENVMLNGEVVRLDGALRMPPKWIPVRRRKCDQRGATRPACRCPSPASHRAR